MTEPLPHIVVTRFNIGTSYFATGRGIDEAWLETRLELFDRFCYPSMVRQTASYQWAVMLDARTPVVYRNRLEEYRERLPSLTPVYLSGVIRNDEIRSAVKEVLGPHSGTLITTRLDNDDCVASDFLARIQQTARNVGRGFINFPIGLQLYKERLYYSIDRSNPFISFVETLDASERPRTVYQGDHRELRKVGPLTQVWAPPLWLQVIHERNVANQLRGVRRIRLAAPRSFGLATSDDDVLVTRVLDAVRSGGQLLATASGRRIRRGRRPARRTTGSI
jgi:hypothetical protein